MQGVVCGRVEDATVGSEPLRIRNGASAGELLILEAILLWPC